MKFALRPKSIIWDHEIHRFPGKDKPASNRSGWYIAFADRRGAVFGDYSQDLRQHWQLDHDGFDAKDRERWREDGRRRAKERAKKAQIALEAMREKWDEASDTVDHPYLKRKGIDDPVGGLRQHGDTLFIPAYEDDGTLSSIQRIYRDSDGKFQKRFWKGRSSKGLSLTLAAPRFFATKTLYLCEGYATGWTIHKALNAAVVVAFNDHGLVEVGKQLRAKYPKAKIIVCADNDQWSTILRGKKELPNPGVIHAREACEAINGLLRIPQFENLDTKPTDFDDLRQLEGMDAVRHWLENSPPDPAPVADEVAERERKSEGFEGLPPKGSNHGVALAIRQAIDTGIAADIGISSSGAIMFHLRGTWYPPEKKNGVSRVAVAEHYALSGGTLHCIRDAFQILAGRVQMNSSPIDFDTQPDIVGLPAKPGQWREVLDLREGEIRRARRDDFVTRSIGARPEAIPTPVFKRLLKQWACDDDRRVKMLRRVMASGLIGRQPERAVFFLLGPKAAGKSVFAALVTMLGGEYIGSLQPSDIGMGKRQKTDELIYGHIEGCRAVFAPELPPGPLRASFLKAVCGGDAVQVRRLYQDPRTFVPAATLILMTNALPGVNVLDPALKDRIRVIQFPETIEEKHRIPKARLVPMLQKELPGILHSLLPDAAELLDEGMSFDPDDFAREDRQTVESWARSADKMRGFCELLVQDPKGRILADDLWTRFIEYLEEIGEETDGWKAHALSRELTNRGFGSADRVGGKRWRIGVRWENGS